MQHNPSRTLLVWVIQDSPNSVVPHFRELARCGWHFSDERGRYVHTQMVTPDSPDYTEIPIKLARSMGFNVVLETPDPHIPRQ